MSKYINYRSVILSLSVFLLSRYMPQEVKAILETVFIDNLSLNNLSEVLHLIMIGIGIVRGVTTLLGNSEHKIIIASAHALLAAMALIFLSGYIDLAYSATVICYALWFIGYEFLKAKNIISTANN